MKPKSSYQRGFSNPRLVIGLFFALLSASLVLGASGVLSKGSGITKESVSSPQTVATTANAKPHLKNVTLRDNPLRYLDENGNRASGIKPGTAVGTKYRDERPVGARAWT